jgi:hypothetical protein
MTSSTINSGGLAGHGVEGGLPVGDRLHRVTGVFQHEFKKFAVGLFVFDHQEARHGWGL